jgi:hypothetical protein
MSDTPSSDESTSSNSRSVTPTQANPFPESLTQARNLLKEHAHVNIFDYLAARKEPNRKDKDYSDLLFQNSRAMMKYTRKEKKFIKLNNVKGEWLQPLLRDFGIKRSTA